MVTNLLAIIIGEFRAHNPVIIIDTCRVLKSAALVEGNIFFGVANFDLQVSIVVMLRVRNCKCIVAFIIARRARIDGPSAN